MKSELEVKYSLGFRISFSFSKGLDNRKSIYIVCIPFVVSGSFLFSVVYDYGISMVFKNNSYNDLLLSYFD